jgi:hypothetical protein
MDEYLDDIHRGAQDGTATVVYKRNKESIVAIVGPNRILNERRGLNAEPLIAVIYSADRGRILTGYQVRELNELTLPDDPRWLAG